MLPKGQSQSQLEGETPDIKKKHKQNNKNVIWNKKRKTIMASRISSINVQWNNLGPW